MSSPVKAATGSMQQSSDARERSLSGYDFGRTAVYACQADQRFSYCLYVPPSLRSAEARSRAEVLVVVHGTERANQGLRDMFAPLADALDVMVLAPLFPGGIGQVGERDAYKYLEGAGVRYDLVLLQMLDEVSDRYGVPTGRVMLFGFSGGAHLAHRFLYLHPERLSAVSVCAPGSTTRLDPERDWWVGVRDLRERFGSEIDLPAVRRVRIHLAVGREDLDTQEITHAPGGAYWMEGANDGGRTRVERLLSLARSLEAADVPCQVDVLEGVAHRLEPLAQAACSFFRGLRGRRIADTGS